MWRMRGSARGMQPPPKTLTKQNNYFYGLRKLLQLQISITGRGPNPGIKPSTSVSQYVKLVENPIVKPTLCKHVISPPSPFSPEKNPGYANVQ